MYGLFSVAPKDVTGSRLQEMAVQISPDGSLCSPKSAGHIVSHHLAHQWSMCSMGTLAETQANIAVSACMASGCPWHCLTVGPSLLKQACRQAGQVSAVDDARTHMPEFDYVWAKDDDKHDIQANI